jgi:hypothetical protein
LIFRRECASEKARGRIQRAEKKNEANEEDGPRFFVASATDNRVESVRGIDDTEEAKQDRDCANASERDAVHFVGTGARQFDDGASSPKIKSR